MFGKILLTALIILAALTWLRLRNQVQPPTSQRRANQPTSRKPLLWALASALLITALGGLFWYEQWSHDQAVVTILVTYPGSGEMTRYQARRSAVHGRRFVTLDGRAISLSDSERMEIQATE